ncbi:RNA polymerase II transcription factor SIII subunit A-domain-containing protein [Rostrohypoxylon terebratum]|nr:RNA polymerase II transcription factor SIII subunit A-domain-containing protein [Rostrohypoxylon terebratum]
MVKSLVELCTKVCIRNVNEIYDIGDMPYSVVRPILLNVNDAQQLLQLEKASPQIQGDDSECWQRLIQRDFPQQLKKQRLVPDDPTLWYMIYQRYKKLEAEEKQAAIRKLSNGFKNITKEKQAKAVKAVNFDKKVHGRIPGQRTTGLPIGRHVTGSGGLTWGGGSRTKTSTSQGILQKARREAAEISRRKQLSTPTGQLLVRKGQITKAPLGMIEEHKTKSLPALAVRRGPIQAPTRSNGERWERQQKEREARLLKAKSGPITKGVTVVSYEDLKDDVDDYSDSEREGGGLSVEDLEDINYYEEKPALTSSTQLAQPPSTTKPGSALSGLAKMKQGHSWKDRPTRVERVVESTKSTTSPASKSFAATSPPPRPSMQLAQLSPPPSASASGADKPRPKLPMGLKRKAPPSVFMPPKQKARRMS